MIAWQQSAVGSLTLTCLDRKNSSNGFSSEHKRSVLFQSPNDIVVGFARDFGYVMLLRCAIVLNSRDGFEEICSSIFRVTRKLGSRTIRRSKILENSSLSWSPRRDFNAMALYL